MSMPHFILVAVENLRQARSLAMTALGSRSAQLRVLKRVPEGYRSALPFGTTEFEKGLATARLMQRESLLSCATMLEGIFGDRPAQQFEASFHTDPEVFKTTLAKAFQFMGLCAAETLVRQRHSLAAVGEFWTPTEFDSEGFMDGLAEVRRLHDLLAGQYCEDSYFYNPYARSAHVPNADYLQSLSQYLFERGKKLALVPVTVLG